MSVPQIMINHPGDGVAIMARVGGLYNETTDHCISLHRDGILQGGVVYTGFLHASIILHMAGNETNWATRDFLWMVFDYAFNQLGCRKLVGLVPAYNSRAIKVDIKLGFRLEGRLTETLADPEEDLLILTMTRDRCKWLKVVPKHYRSNQMNWVN
jgi:L-amino acid N-acyltransferase YncA